MEKQTLKFTIRQDGYVTEEVIGVIGNPVSYTHLTLPTTPYV